MSISIFQLTMHVCTITIDIFCMHCSIRYFVAPLKLTMIFMYYCYCCLLYKLKQLLTLYVLQYYAKFKITNWYLFNALFQLTSFVSALLQLTYFVSSIALDNFILLYWNWSHLATFVCIFHKWQLFYELLKLKTFLSHYCSRQH